VLEESGRHVQRAAHPHSISYRLYVAAMACYNSAHISNGGLSKKMLVPVLSEYDPIQLSEGSLDPLGLYPIADKLAVKLVPGIRERQLHPLFLTAIAAGAHLCAGYDDDHVAHDGESPPWHVNEWYVVEGIVRAAKSGKVITGLPGRLKASDAIRASAHLSAARYLKTPNVFGFNGVYRLLARTLGIIDDNNRLGANGYELLVVWQEEENMAGFVENTSGPGASFREKLNSAVADGLKNGHTSRSGGWDCWRTIYERLRHDRNAPLESKLISEWIMGEKDSLTGELYRQLLSPGGARLWNDSKDEATFHRHVIGQCSYGLKELLDASVKYERFSRLLMNAFDASLRDLTAFGARSSISSIADSAEVMKACKSIPGMYEDVEKALDPHAFAVDFHRMFGQLGVKLHPADWLNTLLQHHEKIQKKKPPNGKMPWFDRFDADSVMVRAGYGNRDESNIRAETQYVHSYRTNSLWSFARDLGLLEVS
jgi:hypothetical protein